MTQIKIETSSYNERRYGKPWIAKVYFPTAKGEFTWGEWVGQSGSSGLLILDAQPGDVVAQGQRDNRKMPNSAPDFYLVEPDLTLRAVTKAVAYEHYVRTKELPPPALSSNDLLELAYSQLQKLNGDSVAEDVSSKIKSFLTGGAS